MRFLENYIDKKVDERINEIIHTDMVFRFRKMTDKEAKSEIKSFILENKKHNITKLSILDFVLSLKLPAEQVENVLGDFKKNKKIRELYA